MTHTRSEHPSQQPVSVEQTAPESTGTRSSSIPHDLFTITDLAPRVGYHPSHLRKLLETGKIDGLKFGAGSKTLWVTTEEEVRRYKEHERKMGRPRKQGAHKP